MYNLYTCMHVLCTSCSNGQPFTVHDNHLFYYHYHINREICGALCMFMCVCTHAHAHTQFRENFVQIYPLIVSTGLCPNCL